MVKEPSSSVKIFVTVEPSVTTLEASPSIVTPSPLMYTPSEKSPLIVPVASAIEITLSFLTL